MEESILNALIIFRYTPEVTPCLKFKMQDPKVTLNIFSTGNIVLTGGAYYEFF